MRQVVFPLSGVAWEIMGQQSEIRLVVAENPRLFSGLTQVFRKRSKESNWIHDRYEGVPPSA
jgi:hypothetical protein